MSRIAEKMEVNRDIERLRRREHYKGQREGKTVVIFSSNSSGNHHKINCTVRVRVKLSGGSV